MLTSFPFIVSALGITQIISWGTIFYGISVLAKPMMAELGWSATFVFAGFSLSLLVGGIVSKPVARFIERRGGRLTLTMGSLVGAFGLAMLSQVNDPIVYIAAWIVLGLASRLTLYDAAFATLVEIYGMRARRPISVLTLFGGLASSIFWPITHYLNEAIGWRGAWLVCALAVLVLCTPLHLLLPRLGTPIGGSEGEAAQPDPEPLVPAEQKAFAVLMLTIAMAGNSFITTALSVHLIPAVVSMGMAAAVAVWISSLRGVFQTLGRLAEIIWGKNLDPFLFANISTGMMVLAFIPLALGGVSVPFFFAFNILFGISVGLATIVKGAVPLVLFGRHGYASVLASIATPGLIVTAMAPTAYAAVLDASGPVAGFWVMFVVSLSSFAATAALAWRFRRVSG
ncbi:MFS transporter [Phreatobacter sp.]|uniref:MFS transporter n=1 Tax=Phreatobacter sp. TaxID=1966341 RepID=UPI0022BBBD19|nr:MFS transporter [Phreatobacter sp.]MCZ8313314.1 MFS transporter [Phreatobacter sp.]